MRNKFFLLIASCVVLAILLSSVLLYDRLFQKNLQEQLATTQGFELPPTTKPTAPTKPGDVVPDFILSDAQGNEMDLTTLKGKPIVILFWASWSTDSTACISYLEALKQEYGDTMHVLLVNLADGVKETRETAEAYLADKNFTCPVYFDDGSVAAKFSTKTVPMVFFLNAEGVAKAYADSAINQTAIDQGLATILPETP